MYFLTFSHFHICVKVHFYGNISTSIKYLFNTFNYETLKIAYIFGPQRNKGYFYLGEWFNKGGPSSSPIHRDSFEQYKKFKEISDEIGENYQPPQNKNNHTIDINDHLNMIRNSFEWGLLVQDI